MATIVKSDGTEKQLLDLSLNSLQTAVGGFIERVWLPGCKRVMYVNEDGLMKNLPQNLQASIMAMQRIVGDAVVLTEAETQREEEEAEAG